jgi:hypothetical protein
MKPTVIAARAFRALAEINKISKTLNDQYNDRYSEIMRGCIESPHQYELAYAIDTLVDCLSSAKRYTLAIAYCCARGNAGERVQRYLDWVETSRNLAIEAWADSIR